jgi:hypothetical protein
MERTRCMILAGGSLVVGTVVLAACGSYGGPPPGGYDAPGNSTASASITVGPPDLPVYDQPVCPGDGYAWTPGYWGWANGDYYWVPGTWVEAPEVGYLWTPGYWGWGGNAFIFHEGYWGQQVGFYGGINYGYGYSGQGFEGGRWDNGHFFYNRSVSNVNVTVVHNVYNTTVVNNTVTRVSYNGGNGGLTARPTRDEETAAQGRHIPPVAAQTQHIQAARSNSELQASVNHGKPPIAATPKPAALNGPGVVAATEAGAIHTSPAVAENNGRRSNTVVHPNDLPPVEHPAAGNTGDPKLDQRNQQQQDKLFAQQSQERLRLQQKQDLDHQRLVTQKADASTTQKLEQQHQQQTQQLAQKHAQQVQALKARTQPPHHDQAVAAKDQR